MTWGLFRRFVQEMEPLRAEWLLDVAQAVSVPHLTKEGASEWFDATIARTRSVAEVAESVQAGEQVTWNGKVLSMFEFKQAVRQGFQAA